MGGLVGEGGAIALFECGDRLCPASSWGFACLVGAVLSRDGQNCSQEPHPCACRVQPWVVEDVGAVNEGPLHIWHNDPPVPSTAGG